MEQLSCNRMCLVKTIDNNTPACVLIEILGSMRFRVDETIINDNAIKNFHINIERNINTSDVILWKQSMTPSRLNNDNQLEFDVETLPSLARFINHREITWTLETLETAFKHILPFITGDYMNVPEVPILCGPKTPDSPESYDASMLYCICKALKIQTNMYMEIEDMGRCIDIYLSPRNSLIKQDTIWINDDLSVSSKSNQMSDPHWLIENYVPKSHEEAIVLAFQRWEIQLFYAASPLKAYTDRSKDRLLTCISKRDDSWLTCRRLLPCLLNFYTEDERKRFVYEEGLEQGEEHLLDTLNPRNHIYEGIHGAYPPRMKHYETMITMMSFKNIDEIENDYIFTIGKVSEHNELKLISLSELNQWFRSQQSFTLPYDPLHYFGNISINKLERFVERNIEISDNIRRKLLIDTRSIINTIRERHASLIDIRRMLRSLDEEEKRQVITYLMSIKDLSFFMRGWKIGSNEDIPLSSSNTQSEESDISYIELNYSKQKNIIVDIFNNMPTELQDMVDTLPLLSRCPRGDFYLCSSHVVGKTISEKLGIIENHQNTDDACIRISSNYLLYSTWYYLDSLGVDSFNINSLDFIS